MATLSVRDPSRVVHRRVSIVTGFCVRSAGSGDTRVSVGTIPEADAARASRPLPFARPWNPSPGRAPPSPPARSSSTRRSPCSWRRSRSWPTWGRAPYVGPAQRGHPGAPAPGEPAADRAPPVPARGPGRHRGRVDRPPRPPPGGSVTDGGPRHPRRGLHRRRASRPPDVAHRRRRSTAALLAVVFVGRAGIAEVALTLIQTELIFIVAWLLGDATRIRRLYAGTLEERAPAARAGARRAGRAGGRARSASGSPASCTTSSRTT